MYASVTDYAAVYDDEYRRRRGDHTSFDRSVLPPLVLSFCKHRGIAKLLDVSGGRGGLGATLRDSGMTTFTTDFGAVPELGVVQFDLASCLRDQTEAVLKEVGSDSEPYVTTCFDVLEHIDREHVASAVRNLAELSDRLLIVSISTRPSVLDNLLHSTLAPIQSWISAFEDAGFQLQSSAMFEAATSKRDFPKTHELSLINRWVECNPFGDIAFGEPRYLVFEKIKTVGEWDAVVEKIDTTFDVAFRKVKRRDFSISRKDRINFNLHHPQEWSLVRPILDVLPRDQVRFLLRTEAFNGSPDTLRAIRSFLKRSGVAILEFDDIRELPWTDIKGEILISGAESSVGSTHLLSQELVAVARIHGCTTYLLQHGIWPRPFHERIVTFASERIITWGREEEVRLKREHPFFGTSAPWGLVGDSQIHRLGSAKYADQLIKPHAPLHAILGFDPSEFEKTVLIGTKNLRGRWGLNNITDGFIEELGDLIAQHPTSMFIIRPHPTDSAEQWTSIRHSNVRMLDEVCGVLADISLSRIMPGIDHLLTSPSSLVLDGAVSSKPTFVYSTGQPHELDGVVPEPLAQSSKLLEDGQSGEFIEIAKQFKAKFGEEIRPDFYSRFSQLLATPGDGQNLDVATASIASLAVQAVELQRSRSAAEANVRDLERTVAEQTARTGHTSNELNERSRDLEAEKERSTKLLAMVNELESHISQLKTHSSELRRKISKLKNDRRVMTSSRSWRYTSPVRNMFDFMSRLRSILRKANHPRS